MYIRTPKKYRGPQRRSVLNCGHVLRVMLWLTLIALIVVGLYFYQNSEQFRPVIDQIVGTAVVQMQGGVATLQAPPPTPTEDPLANITQGDNAWSVGNVGGALDAYMQIMPSVPNDVNIHYRVTMGLLTNGDDSEALAYAERTITADPFEAYGWAARALALYENNRDAEAITSALQALDLDDENVPAMAFLALAYYGVGRDQTGFSWAERAINADPDRFEGYYARAILYENSLQYLDPNAALADYQVAYDLAQQQNPALAGNAAVGIARVQERNGFATGDFEPAIATLEEVLQQNPSNTEALFRLGTIQRSRRGDPNQALPHFQNCVEVDPTNQSCLYWLGRTQNDLGNKTEALELFLTLVDEMGSTDGYHYYWAGQIHLDLGSCDIAGRYWSRGYSLVLNGSQASDTALVSSYEALPPCAGINSRTVPLPGDDAAQPTATPEAIG